MVTVKDIRCRDRIRRDGRLMLLASVGAGHETLPA